MKIACTNKNIIDIINISNQKPIKTKGDGYMSSFLGKRGKEKEKAAIEARDEAIRLFRESANDYRKAGFLLKAVAMMKETVRLSSNSAVKIEGLRQLATTCKDLGLIADSDSMSRQADELEGV